MYEKTRTIAVLLLSAMATAAIILPSARRRNVLD